MDNQVIIGVIADVHHNGEDSPASDSYRTQADNRLISTMLALDAAGVQSVLQLADLTDSGDDIGAELDIIEAIFHDSAYTNLVGIARLHVLGNHDFSGTTKAAWLAGLHADDATVVTDTNYSYDIPGTNIHMVVIDTNYDVNGDDLVGSTTYVSDVALAWLETDLATADDAGKFSIVAGHHHLHPRTYDQGTGIVNTDAVLAVLCRHKVVMYLHGHLHPRSTVWNTYENKNRDGERIIIKPVLPLIQQNALPTPVTGNVTGVGDRTNDPVPGTNEVRMTCDAAHNLAVGDTVLHAGFTDYNGTANVSTVEDSTHYRILHAYQGNETGTFEKQPVNYNIIYINDQDPYGDGNLYIKGNDWATGLRHMRFTGEYGANNKNLDNALSWRYYDEDGVNTHAAVEDGDILYFDPANLITTPAYIQNVALDSTILPTSNVFITEVNIATNWVIRFGTGAGGYVRFGDCGTIVVGGGFGEAGTSSIWSRYGFGHVDVNGAGTDGAGKVFILTASMSSGYADKYISNINVNTGDADAIIKIMDAGNGVSVDDWSVFTGILEIEDLTGANSDECLMAGNIYGGGLRVTRETDDFDLTTGIITAYGGTVDMTTGTKASDDETIVCEQLLVKGPADIQINAQGITMTNPIEIWATPSNFITMDTHDMTILANITILVDTDGDDVAEDTITVNIPVTYGRSRLLRRTL